MKKKIFFIIVSIIATTNTYAQTKYHAYLPSAWPGETTAVSGYDYSWSALENGTVIVARKITSVDSYLRIYSVKPFQHGKTLLYKIAYPFNQGTVEVLTTRKHGFILVDDGESDIIVATDGTRKINLNEIYKAKRNVELADDSVLFSTQLFRTTENKLLFGVTELWADRKQNNKISIWSSDGTVSGTKELATLPSIYSSISMAFERDDALYLFEENYNGPNDDTIDHRLWKKTEGNSLELVHTYHYYGSNMSTSSGSVITTSNGSFHCIRSTLTGDADLWKIDKNDNTFIIALGCDASTLFNHGEKIYYSNSAGLWFTDGTSKGEKLIFPLENTSFKRSDSKSCVIEGNIYKILSRATNTSTHRNHLLKIDINNNKVAVIRDLTGSNVNKANNYVISGCFENALVLNNESELGKDYLFYNAKTNTISTLPGFANDNPYTTAYLTDKVNSFNSRTLYAPGNSSNSPTRLYEPKELPFYISPYNFDITDLIPRIMLLILNEED